MIKNSNRKVTTNSQLSTTEPKKPQTKQTTRRGTESQKWRSHGGLSVRKQSGEEGAKGTGNKKHKWQVQNRQGMLRIVVQEMEKPKNLYV